MTHNPKAITVVPIAQPLRLLLVEDNTHDAVVFRRAFQQSDVPHQISECYRGEQALDLLLLNPSAFDLVVVDYKLPGMTGLDLCRELIRQQFPLPVVILTGAGTEHLAVEALKAGVADYIIKDPGRGYLDLLPIVLPQAVRQYRDRLARQQAEETLRQSEKELHRYSLELQARNEELDRFAQTVAHELQTPLANIIGFADTLRNYEMTEEERKKYTCLIVEIGQKMSNIIHDLLLLTSVRKLNVQPTPLDMNKVVAEAQTHLAGMVEQYQAKIIIPDSWPTALGYGPWIEEVWTNYISNAIKYGGRPPVVELGVTSQPDGMVCFWVRDNGAGLTPDEQDQLFKPFTRLKDAKIKGNGLGLSIVRHIVEKLGGQVGVTGQNSQAEGATFSFTLPGSEDL